MDALISTYGLSYMNRDLVSNGGERVTHCTYKKLKRKINRDYIRNIRIFGI